MTSTGQRSRKTPKASVRSTGRPPRSLRVDLGSASETGSRMRMPLIGQKPSRSRLIRRHRCRSRAAYFSRSRTCLALHGPPLVAPLLRARKEVLQVHPPAALADADRLERVRALLDDGPEMLRGVAPPTMAGFCWSRSETPGQVTQMLSRSAVTCSGSPRSRGTWLTLALMPAAWKNASSGPEVHPRTRNRGVESSRMSARARRLHGLRPGPVDVGELGRLRPDVQAQDPIQPPAEPEQDVQAEAEQGQPDLADERVSGSSWSGR